MSTGSAIEWCDATWSPTTGCDRVSPGCDNCYALTLAKRLKAMGSAKYQRDGNPRTSGPGFGLTTHENALDLPLHWRKPRKVFVNSMSDLFHKDVSDEFIGSVFDVMARTPRHTYQILTKRHGRMRSLLNRWAEAGLPGPLPNVHLGVSVEDQKHADLRIPALLDTPAAVRFLSCEPLLGPVNLDRHLYDHALTSVPSGDLHWVIVGGESGSGARPLELDWVRSIVNQCGDAGVPVFVKQLGSVWAGSGKGGDMDAWPADLRVRQFPEVAS